MPPGSCCGVLTVAAITHFVETLTKTLTNMGLQTLTDAYQLLLLLLPAASLSFIYRPCHRANEASGTAKCWHVKVARCRRFSR